jgi:hypothetical protein
MMTTEVEASALGVGKVVSAPTIPAEASLFKGGYAMRILHAYNTTPPPTRPSVGTVVVTRHGQTYALVGYASHIRRDGQTIILARYRSTCAEPGCDAVFEVKTSLLHFDDKKMVRRCIAHRAPGRVSS